MLLKSEDIAEVFREAYPNLCRFLESILKERGAAQDIAQESFLKLCATSVGDIPKAEMKYWLFRVGRNLALNEIGRSKTRHRFKDSVAKLFLRKNPTPAENLEASENARLVRELVKTLPEHQRSALMLREQEEMSYHEIALVLDVSESKVKVDIFRGRTALREKWFEQQSASERN